MPKVTIYTTPTCHYCHAAKEFFKDNNIAYEEHDVAADAEKRNEMMEKSGQMGVPVIMVTPDSGQPEIIVGFDEARLKELLIAKA